MTEWMTGATEYQVTKYQVTEFSDNWKWQWQCVDETNTSFLFYIAIAINCIGKLMYEWFFVLVFTGQDMVNQGVQYVCSHVCMYVYCMYRWLLSHPPIIYCLYYYSLNNSIVIYDNWKGQWCLGVCLCDFVSILSLILKLIKTTFSKLLCLQVIISSHKISSAFNLIINSLSNFSTSLAPRISLSFFWEKVEVEKEEVE